MRHQNTGRQLSRNSAHRAALMQNMAVALLRHETIRTTLPKAKELRRTVEPLITLAREDNVAKRRLAYARLRDHEVVTKLFADLGPHFKSRPGGYTRILKFGFRAGDKAPMAVMQLVDREAQIAAVADKHAQARKAKQDAAAAAAKAAEESAATDKQAAKEEKAKAKEVAKAEKAEAKKTRKAAKADKPEAPKAEKKVAKKPVKKAAKKKDD